MQLVFVGIGLCMVSRAVHLRPSGTMMGPRRDRPRVYLGAGRPQRRHMRVTITGTPTDAQRHFNDYRAALLVPGPMRTHMNTGAFVPIRIPPPEAPTSTRSCI